MPTEVLLYIPASLAVALALAAFAEHEPLPALKRAARMWGVLLIGGALFGLLVAIAQHPEMVLMVRG